MFPLRMDAMIIIILILQSGTGTPAIPHVVFKAEFEFFLPDVFMGKAVSAIPKGIKLSDHVKQGSYNNH
jgi:hypothetical protein